MKCFSIPGLENGLRPAEARDGVAGLLLVPLRVASGQLPVSPESRVTGHGLKTNA